MQRPEITRSDLIGWVGSGAALLSILYLKLLPALIAALLVFALVNRLTPLLSVRFLRGRGPRVLAVSLIAALVIAAIVFAIFFIMLRRAKPEEISFELVDDTTDNAAKAALPSGSGEDPASFLPTAKSLKVSPELLNTLIRQKPENVGATLREWLTTKNE